MTFNLFVQQTRPRDAFPVLISLLVLHAAPYDLARKCTSLRPTGTIAFFLSVYAFGVRFEIVV